MKASKDRGHCIITFNQCEFRFCSWKKGVETINYRTDHSRFGGMFQLGSCACAFLMTSRKLFLGGFERFMGVSCERVEHHPCLS